ncbi:hypothetical protein COL91_04835 [Bacillus pseudomycoides]|nr:hypothetical protein COO02_06415 [Bacillus pseudomycoides]PGA93461.1 hypothetical protein COL91_04835 [Bacillus pseudomycoides]PHF50878.1 hypothetical protein COF72_03020 [Bacillus pseudomycoides]
MIGRSLPSKKECFDQFFIICPLPFPNIYITAMKPKKDLHSLSLFGFTWYGAKKSTDRFYA